MLPILLNKTVSCLLPQKIWRNAFSPEKKISSFWCTLKCRMPLGTSSITLVDPNVDEKKSDGKPSVVGCKTQSKVQKYKKGHCLPVPGRKNVENCHISQAFTCALPWSKLHKLTQMIRENLGPWPPGFFDASDSHGDRYNNHCPSRHGNLRLVSRLIWETDNR